MTNREELPKGWQMLATTDGKFRAWSNQANENGRSIKSTEWCDSRSDAAQLAWRIVEVEREAADGR